MKMSTQLLLTRIEQNKENIAKNKIDHTHKQVCVQRDQLLDELDSIREEHQQLKMQNS